jgi:hypothetical protein
MANAANQEEVLIEIARMCYEINRLYRQLTGDYTSPSWSNVEEEHREIIISSAVYFILVNQDKVEHLQKLKDKYYDFPPVEQEAMTIFTYITRGLDKLINWHKPMELTLDHMLSVYSRCDKLTKTQLSIHGLQQLRLAINAELNSFWL